MNWRGMERITKGIANHRRLEILDLLHKKPELSVDEIATELKINLKTASEHLRRMALSGLIMKRYEAQFVRHKITSRGSSILKFLRILE